MQRTKIQTSEAPAAIGPYSQAIRVGQFLYASGQIPLDPASGELVGSNVQEQTERVFQNMQAVLASAGGCVTTATVKEQLLYELGDPKNYITPPAPK